MTAYKKPSITREEQNKMMSPGYWAYWNKKEQARIDRDIEKYRKADYSAEIKGVPAGARVNVEQLSHSFIFGAHIFNFDQLGSDERNRRYKELYGTLFNSATIAFYWKTFEQEEGKPRFKGEHRDTAEFWNAVAEPANEKHWRRPATDPVVEFCESKGIRLHGHPIVWGNAKWQYPEWLMKKLPEKYHGQLTLADNNKSGMEKIFEKLTPEQIEALLPEFTSELNAQMAKRILDIAIHYKGRLHSWDVCNESAVDFEIGCLLPGSGICKSCYGLMPGDYAYRSFKIADAVFPGSVKLNINDYMIKPCYAEQAIDMLKRGCKIDIMGLQMHLFDTQTCLDIANGKTDIQSPKFVRDAMSYIAPAKLPLHLSEITITSPNNDERGQHIQAVIARNLYRLWFSMEKMMGITWWNVVDGCGAPKEPAVSGIFSRNMEPKPAYFALDDLINNEWKTNIVVKAGKNGSVEFRGFRGKYRLSWTGKDGKNQSKIID